MPPTLHHAATIILASTCPHPTAAAARLHSPVRLIRSLYFRNHTYEVWQLPPTANFWRDALTFEYINLDSTYTSAKGLVHLQGLTKLRELRFLPMAGCTDESLQYLRNMNKFKTLNLSSSSITDKGLECLAGLTGLEDLNLSETLVGGAGLKYIKNLKRLKYLDLRMSAIDDSAAVHLREMKWLSELRIIETKMSEKVVEELKRHLPNTKVP